MGLVKAFVGALEGTLADQWKDIWTAGPFDEHTLVAPAVQRKNNRGRGSNLYGSTGILTDRSKIYVPENTAAFVFDQAGIEEVVTEAGGYEYHNGQASVFSGAGFSRAIWEQAKERIGYGGIPAEEKKLAFVNLREIRDIKFGTHGPQVYHDCFYEADLEIMAHGVFAIQVKDPVALIQNFVPPNVTSYSLDDPGAREQLVSEFLQSFVAALNALSGRYRISQLPAQAGALSQAVTGDLQHAGSWNRRFGFELVKVAVENIEFTKESRALVQQYAATRMDMKAYENVSMQTADIAAKQKIAQGIREKGIGNAGGLLLGLNLAQGPGGNTAAAVQPQKPEMSIDEQIDAVKKLKELLDAGILTEEEFSAKKKELMGL